MSKPITKIAIKSFRGASTPLDVTLDPSIDMTMIFGENGTGKSTILDAIDLVANKSIGALEDISCEGNKKSYLASIGHSRTSLQATLHSNGESWTATLSGSSVNVAGSPNGLRVRMLRRSRVLELITAKPSDRYEVLRHFVDVGNVEKAEISLAKKITSLGKSIDRVVRDRSLLGDQLRTHWDSNGRSGKSALDWANKQTVTDISDLKSQAKELKKIVSAIDEAIKRKNVSERAAVTSEKATKVVDSANQVIANMPGIDPNTAVKLVDALTKAQDYITSTSDLQACPTCLRSIQQDELSTIVANQLEAMTELKNARDEQQRASKALDTATQNETQATQLLSESAKAFHTTLQEKSIPEIATLQLPWPDWENPGEDLVKRLIAIVESLEAVVELLRTNSEDVTKKVNQYDVIKKLVDDIEEANTTYEQLQRIKVGLDNALDIVRSKRIAFTQRILNEIAGETNRLYQAIHPNESIEFSGLKMDEDKRGSVYQVGTFHGHNDVPPQAFFSESHLDTLGFCVWLALAKRQKAGETIIIIDDVFSSADARHLSRIVDLLAVESQHFCQVIVATHYRNWLDQYTNARGPGKLVERIRLGRWHIDTGIQSRKTPLAIDDLDDLLKGAFVDRQAIASKTGILLESLLNQLTMQCGCKIARARNDEYTLQPLLDGGTKLFRKPLTVTKNVTWDEPDADEPCWEEFPAKDAFITLCDSVYLPFRGSAFHFLRISFPTGRAGALRPIT